MTIREIAQHLLSHRFPSFLIAFAQLFPLLLPEFPIAFARISGKVMGNSGKSNGKNWAKAMRKLGKRRHIFRAKIIAFARISHCFFPEFPIALARIFYCFFPNFLLLLPEIPIAFARISHCFCPNFSFSNFFGGHSAPPPPRLLRLCLILISDPLVLDPTLVCMHMYVCGSFQN